MMIRKTLTILAASCMMYSCGTKTESNPFFTEFQTEYGVPSFDKIKLENYEPAFLKGIEEQNQNIQAIIASPEVPTFDNTIVALDNSAPILDRVSAIFFNMTDAETTDELTELSIKMAPVLSEHEDNISLNQELFKRVNAVYQQKDSMNLTTEQQRLLDKTYKGFVRSGANLDAEKQARLREINKELFIEVVERTDRHFPLLVVIFQTPQRSEVGSLGTFNATLSFAIYILFILANQSSQTSNRILQKLFLLLVFINDLPDNSSRQVLSLHGKLFVHFA